MRFANMLHWIYLNITRDICWGFSGAPGLRSYASKCFSSATNPRAGVSYSHTATQYRLDWLYCQMGLAKMQHLIYCNETYDRTEISPVCLNVVEWCLFYSFDLEMCTGLRIPVHHHLQLTNNSKPTAASSSTFDLCLFSWYIPARNLYCSLSIDFISYWSLLIIKNTNVIPL